LIIFLLLTAEVGLFDFWIAFQLIAGAGKNNVFDVF